MSATRLQSASLISAARLLAVAAAMVSPAAYGQAQRWQHDFGVQMTSPMGPTAFLGTNGAGVSAERGRFQAQVGTGSENTTAGIGGCVRAYPAPVPYFPAVRAGGELCGYVTPQGLQTTVAPGVMLPNGATANMYYANTYNPMAPSAAQFQAAAEEAARQAALAQAQAAAQWRAQQAQQEQMRQYELAMRQQVAQYAYNPPADVIAPYVAAQPAPAAATPAAAPATTPVQSANMPAPSSSTAQAIVQSASYPPAAIQSQSPRFATDESAPQPQQTYYDDSAPRVQVPSTGVRQAGTNSPTASLASPY